MDSHVVIPRPLASTVRKSHISSSGFLEMAPDFHTWISKFRTTVLLRGFLEFAEQIQMKYDFSFNFNLLSGNKYRRSNVKYIIR